MKKVYTVYDNKAAVFANPFTSHTNATALRDFQAASCDSQSQISQYPEDFVLFEIGTFDEDKGILTPIIPLNLGSADQFTFRG